MQLWFMQEVIYDQLTAKMTLIGYILSIRKPNARNIELSGQDRHSTNLRTLPFQDHPIIINQYHMSRFPCQKPYEKPNYNSNGSKYGNCNS